MNKIFIFFIACLFVASCGKHECTNYPCSVCINEKIEQFKASEDSKSILTMYVDNEIYYWFNTDAVFFDGTEEIFNEACEQVCIFCGECIPPPCNEKFPYDKTKWQVYWQK